MNKIMNTCNEADSCVQETYESLALVYQKRKHIVEANFFVLA